MVCAALWAARDGDQFLEFAVDPNVFDQVLGRIEAMLDHWKTSLQVDFEPY